MKIIITMIAMFTASLSPLESIKTTNVETVDCAYVTDLGGGNRIVTIASTCAQAKTAHIAKLKKVMAQ